MLGDGVAASNGRWMEVEGEQRRLAKSRVRGVCYVVGSRERVYRFWSSLLFFFCSGCLF